MLAPASLTTGLLLVTLGAFVGRGAFRLARLVRRLADLQPTPISGTRPGLAMARGRLQGAPLLRSPFEGRSCIYYFFRVTEPKPNGRTKTLATGKEWTLAKLDDGTGVANIEPWTAIVASPRRHTTTFAGLRAIPPGLAAFFERAGIDEKHLPRIPRFQVDEYTLQPDDDVVVTGTLTDDGEEKVFYRAKGSPLIVSSDPEIGHVARLRHELFLRAAVAPMLLAAGTLLVVLALV